MFNSLQQHNLSVNQSNKLEPELFASVESTYVV